MEAVRSSDTKQQTQGGNWTLLDPPEVRAEKFCPAFQVTCSVSGFWNMCIEDTGSQRPDRARGRYMGPVDRSSIGGISCDLRAHSQGRRPVREKRGS